MNVIMRQQTKFAFGETKCERDENETKPSSSGTRSVPKGGGAKLSSCGGEDIVLEIDERTSMVNVTDLCSLSVLKQFIYQNLEYILAVKEVEHADNLIQIPGFDIFKNAEVKRQTTNTKCWMNKYIAIKLAFYINPTASLYWKLCF